MKEDQMLKVMAAASMPYYLESESTQMCYDIVMGPNTNIGIPDSFFDTFYRTKLPSFEAFQTNKITLTDSDFYKMINSHHSYINDITEITGNSYNQVMLDFGRYYEKKQFLIRPGGLSGVLHKLSNTLYLSTATVNTAFATASSHLSGVTGINLLGAAPGLILFVPLVGGVFFGAAERLAADTPVQGVLILARDTCLIVPKIVEVAHNEIGVGRLLRVVGIDAPLNVTSMLRFGAGTKRVMGGVLNSTINTLTVATTNLQFLR